MAAEVSDSTRKFIDANKGRLRNPAMLVSRQSVLSQYGCKEVNKTQIQVSLKTMDTVTKRTFYLDYSNYIPLHHISLYAIVDRPLFAFFNVMM